MLRLLVILFIICGSISCSNDTDKCGNRIECVDKELIKYLDEADQQPKLSLIDDFVVLEKINDGEEVKSEDGIIERCIRFLGNHQLKISIPGSITGRALAEESRTRKLRKIILPLLLLLKLKAAIVVPAVLAVIGFTAFTGFGVSLMALTVASVMGLKSLVEGHHHPPRLTYEIVPQVAAWSRSGIEAYPAGYHTIP